MFVIGCHRSGTSLLASLLSSALGRIGLRSGEQDEFLATKLENPGGFFETQKIVRFNESLFSALSCDWPNPPLHPINWQHNHIMPSLIDARNEFSDLALSSTWVDKDPRLCITYPAFYHVLLRRVPVAAIIRHPFAVARSLQARNGLTISQSLLIWFLYNQHLARVIHEDADVLVGYERLVSFDSVSLSRLHGFLAPHQIAQSQWQESVRKCIRKEWVRSSVERPVALLPEPEWAILADHCLRVYEDVKSADFATPAFKQSFRAVPESVLVAYALCAPVSFCADQSPGSVACADFGRLQERNQQLENELIEFRRSTIWCLTAPLRRLLDAVKR